ncbi:hypothetical protein D3C78_1614300 [compost metagenome]
MEKVETVVHIIAAIQRLIIVRSLTYQRKASGNRRRLIVHIRRSLGKLSIVGKNTKTIMRRATG